MAEYLLPMSVNWPFNRDLGPGYYPTVGPHPFTPIGGHNSVVLTTDVLTLDPPEHAVEVLVQILDVNCRFTLDGTEPTTSSGFQLVARDALIISISRSTIIKIVGENTGAGVEYQFGR